MAGNYDALVVGAGLWGATVARRLADAGQKVRVLESRPVIGGNCRCEIDPATGIEVHIYGSHIFHTNNTAVWAFLSRFMELNAYHHQVLAKHNGELYFLPLGLALVNRFYQKQLTPSELPAFIAAEAGHAEGEPRNFEDQAIRLIGRPLYEAFIREYTRKQWNRDPKELSAAIICRLPVRVNYDVGYFTARYQGIPAEGFNRLFERMLDHPNIHLELNTPFTLGEKNLPVYSSAPLDALFGYRLGPLTWRSLRFETVRQPVMDWQGTSVINYVDADVPWTRIHEYKHYHPEWQEAFAAKETIIAREYPADWHLGDEPYYPVATPETAALVERYRQLAKEYPNMVIGGRLGAYRYYDMDQSVAAALETADRALKENK